jgi:FAD/FMN-containing dehydrogenase/ferredoxin
MSTKISDVELALAGRLSGELRSDRLARVLYATDASIYEITPDAVVLPKNVDDVITTVQACREHNVPVTGRGGGTGLHGGAINRGVILDFARYMNRVLELDIEHRRVRVEPGVVLDELNAELARHGLQFPADVATSSRATLGGMIANNSCGAHSLIYGRTVDHVLSLDVVLSDGTRYTWGRNATPPENPLAQRCELAIRRILEEHADEIAQRFPKVKRSNGGYALDRLKYENGQLNVEAMLSGSEGTLGVIVGAELNVIPLPRHKGLVCVHYDDLVGALNTVAHLLTHEPAAIELVDKFILDATRDNPAMQRRRWFLQGDPAALLTVEFYEDDEARLAERMQQLQDDLKQRGIGYAYTPISEPQRQEDVWAVRKGGTGLLMSRPGPVQPYDFVDDTAVDPGRLGQYIERLGTILREEGCLQAGYYGHASVGVVHVRPALNLRQDEDIRRLRRIADRVSRLVAEFHGAMTGEHGDGIVRSEWIARTYGPTLMRAFAEIKATFDPDNLFNPGKIIDPLPMDGTLRYGRGFESHEPETMLDFSTYGGMAGLADMCSGIGQCRQRLVGTMCPSYMATDDETHTTRARANALRVALSNRGLLEGLADPALDEVMDLCLSCKACKTECPTGTDIAKLKAEWLFHKNERAGVPSRSRLIASSIEMAKWGCHFAPLSNWVMQSKVTRIIMEHLFGLDRRVPPPRFARQTFRDWHRQAQKRRAAQDARRRHNRAPPRRLLRRYVDELLRAAGGPGHDSACWRRLGFEVRRPRDHVLRAPANQQGPLARGPPSRRGQRQDPRPLRRPELPIVGTEPSCISALVDEMPQFVRETGAPPHRRPSRRPSRSSCAHAARATRRAPFNVVPSARSSTTATAIRRPSWAPATP